MYKLRWSGCKRFTSGHGIAGTVSGVEAAIHCGDELWFGVGIEVSERKLKNVNHKNSNDFSQKITRTSDPFSSVVKRFMPLNQR